MLKGYTGKRHLPTVPRHWIGRMVQVHGKHWNEVVCVVFIHSTHPGHWVWSMRRYGVRAYEARMKKRGFKLAFIARVKRQPL